MFEVQKQQNASSESCASQLMKSTTAHKYQYGYNLPGSWHHPWEWPLRQLPELSNMFLIAISTDFASDFPQWR